MRNARKLILVITVAILMSGFLQGQAVMQGNDTIKTEQAKEQMKEKREGNDNGVENSSSSNDKISPAEKNKSTKVKQVKGARPDMTKAKGARPQTIERPSGSRIPKGIGRPGGAGKPGGK